jgi:putative membrane protein
MKLFYGVLKVLLVLMVLSFALKNTDTVSVRYYLGVQWQAPLIVVMLAAFAAGVAAGAVASLTQVARVRRELAALRRGAAAPQVAAATPLPARGVDGK